MSGGVADNKFPVVMTGTCGQFTSFTVPNQRTLSTLIALKKIIKTRSRNVCWFKHRCQPESVK